MRRSWKRRRAHKSDDAVLWAKPKAKSKIIATVLRSQNVATDRNSTETGTRNWNAPQISIQKLTNDEKKDMCIKHKMFPTTTQSGKCNILKYIEIYRNFLMPQSTVLVEPESCFAGQEIIRILNNSKVYYSFNSSLPMEPILIGWKDENYLCVGI